MIPEALRVNIGICLLMTRHDFDMVGLARKVEELGFDSLWAPEHGVVPADFGVDENSMRAGAPSAYGDGRINQIIDPLVFLAAAAGATRRVKLGTGICLVPERNPIRLAKEVATLDLISGGRFLFGIGAGWLRGESEILGGDFPRRWSQTKEHVLAMKDLWTNPVSEFHGKWVDYPPIICDPKPVQKPHPPVLIGGELERSAQRIADYGDGWLPRARSTSKYHDPGELPAARRHIEDLYHERGRDPANLTITMWDAPPDREKNRQFFDVGADHIVHMLVTADEASAREQLERTAEAVL